MYFSLFFYFAIRAAAVTKNTSGIKSHALRYQHLLRFSTAAVMNVENKEQIRLADEALLASLGYKQEFKRAFTPLEVGVAAGLCYLTCANEIPPQVFGIAFSIIGLLPSIASVLFYAIPNGGGPAMVWGVSSIQVDLIFRAPDLSILVASSQYFHSPRWDVNGGTGLSCSNIWRGTSRQRDFSHPTI
jgi:hypothetical protein